MAEASISKISACRYLKVETGSVCWPLLVTMTVWFEHADSALVKNPSFVWSVGTSCSWQSWFWANTFCRCANTSLGMGAKHYTTELWMLCSPTLHTITQQQILFPNKTVAARWSVCDQLFCVVYSGRHWCENSITNISRRAYGTYLTRMRYSITNLWSSRMKSRLHFMVYCRYDLCLIVCVCMCTRVCACSVWMLAGPGFASGFFTVWSYSRSRYLLLSPQSETRTHTHWRAKFLLTWYRWIQISLVKTFLFITTVELL